MTGRPPAGVRTTGDGARARSIPWSRSVVSDGWQGSCRPTTTTPTGWSSPTHAASSSCSTAAAEQITGTSAQVRARQGPGDALPLEGLDGRAWWPCARPYDGLRTATGHPERNLHPARRPGGPGHRALRARRATRSGAAGGRRAARHPAPGPRGAQPRRAGVDRRPRAALAAHQRQGLHRDPARQVGPVQRRPEAPHARDGRRRRRPGHPADHRAARHRPDRLAAGSPCAARSSTSAEVRARGTSPAWWRAGEDPGPVRRADRRRHPGDVGRRRQARPGARQPAGERRAARLRDRDDRAPSRPASTTARDPAPR